MDDLPFLRVSRCPYFGPSGIPTIPGEDALVMPYLVAMSVRPSSPPQRTALDTLAKALRAAGLVPKLDRLYLLHSHHEQASRVNFLNPAETPLSAVNAPTFAAFSGWTGDGVSRYMAQPDTYAFSGANFELNSASIGIGVGATSGPGTRAMAGNISGNASSITLRSGPNDGSLRMHDAAALVIPGASHGGSRSGSFLGTRTSAAARKFYYNGAGIADDTAASTGVSNQTACLMRNSAAYTADTFWYYLSGGGLTDTEALDLHNALTAYRAAYVA